MHGGGDVFMKKSCRLSTWRLAGVKLGPNPVYRGAALD